MTLKLSNNILLIALFALVLSDGMQAPNTQQNHGYLPEGFVYLQDYNPRIKVNLRYATDDNFLGRKVPFYNGRSAICTEQAANALSKAQTRLQVLGYGLVIYDAYRPASSTQAFVDWASDQSDINETSKMFYYPYIKKSSIIPDGYVAQKSGHNRGSTVDLTIIKLGEQIKPISEKTVVLKDGTEIYVPFDNSVEMGSGFDLFHEVSHHGSPLVSSEGMKNRELLKGVMQQYGFNMYLYEWWHYTLANQPFPDTYFDFPIVDPPFLENS